MSLYKFFKSFIMDADVYVEIFDANMRKILFRDKWLNIKELDKEYLGNRYRVMCIEAMIFVERGGYPGFSITIDLNR